MSRSGVLNLCRVLAVAFVVAGSIVGARVSLAAVTNPPAGDPTGLIPVGPGAVESSSRQVVRTPDGRVYIAAIDDGGNTGSGHTHLAMYRADATGVPTAFTEADPDDAPSADGTRISGYTLSGGDARLDRDGIVHVVYFDTYAHRAMYARFDTATDR